MSDIFKEVPIRILGFSFGVGQAAMYGFHRRTELCNQIGAVFVVSHLVYNGVTEQSGMGLVKTFAFEAICTCIIPPVINYYLCSIVHDIVSEMKFLPHVVRKWAPFLFGCLTIPLLILFVDPPVDEFINSILGGE